MYTNQRRLLEILRQQHDKIEDRCDGYKEELLEKVAQILYLERQHSVQRTNIQQKIMDQCAALGEYLSKKRTDLE